MHFVDVAAAAGLKFQHFSPLSPQRHVHLTMGGGVAWLDYDHDDLPDLYFSQGDSWPPASTHVGTLYRNTGEGAFADVTAQAGLTEAIYGMGIAVGDRDDDGFADLFVSGFGRCVLYANNGDGTFSEISTHSGIAPTPYGASCTWCDFNADGALDVYVVNYLDIDPQNYQLCKEQAGANEVFFACHPQQLKGVYDVLYQSRGDGTYADVSRAAGLHSDPPRQGLGVIAADLDEDGDLDFYVANDTVPNQLWDNQGDGTFLSSGLLSGTAVNRNGVPEAGMGVAVGDLTGHGRPDLFVTNYFAETNTLYRNEGELQFWDVTDEFGLGSPSRLRLGFGTCAFDADNDGRLDLFVANGHVHDRLHVFGRNEPYAQRALMFRNHNFQRFADLSEQSGEYFRSEVVGRGAAAADFDRDGRTDIAVSHLNAAPALLHNRCEPHGNWLRIKLVGTASQRDAFGTRLQIDGGKSSIVRWKTAGSSYLSCDEPLLTIGVEDGSRCDVSVTWPAGAREQFENVPVNRTVVLVEGTAELRELKVRSRPAETDP